MQLLKSKSFATLGLVLVTFFCAGRSPNGDTLLSGNKSKSLQNFNNTSEQDGDKNADLEEAKRLFNRGEFEKAIAILDRLIVTKTLTKDLIQEASELLAVALVSNNQDDRAKQVFVNLLKADRNYRPNDQWWPHRRLINNYFRSMQEAGISLQVEKPDPGIKTIAIMDFDNNSIDDAERLENLGKALSKILITDMTVLSNLRVVERERLQFLLDELKVEQSQFFDQATTAKIGKVLGAHSFVFGSFIRIGKRLRKDAGLVKTETGEIFKTASVEGKPDKIFELAKKLILKIVNNLDVTIKKIEEKQLDDLGGSNIPIEALALWGEAIDRANRDKYKDAYKNLEQALALAPRFPPARALMDVIRPLSL